MKKYVPEIYIIQKQGQILTTSLDVAEKFGKRHDNVLQSIRKIVEEMPERGALNFKETSYIDESNRRKPMYDITRSGFSVLVMGFNGRKALEWKFLYEDAFSKMEHALLNQSNISWQDDRKAGKITRREETDVIRDFVEYAHSQGSTKANFYYKHLTNATYKALFLVADKFPGQFRDLLNSRQLSFLRSAEIVAADALKDGMAQGLFYKDIFQLAKTKLQGCAQIFGVSPVIAISQQLSLPTPQQQSPVARV